MKPMKLNTYKDNIYTSFMILLGLVMFSIFIYLKFIRERIPKDIPFTLSVLGFFILIEICCIYAYLVWTNVKPSKKPNEIFILVVNTVLSPLYALDNYIKNFYIINKLYTRIFIWISHHCMYMFKTPIFETLFFVMPRICLITTFLFDVFYFSELKYIYYVLIIMGLILLIRRYFIYSLNKLKSELLNDLKKNIEQIITIYEFGIHPSEWPENFDPDEEDADDIPETMALDLDIFVNYYAKNKIYNNNIEINFLTMTDSFYKLFDTHDIDRYKVYKKQEEILKIELVCLLEISVVCEYLVNLNHNKFFKKFKITIYALYFLCWSYILFMSLFSLNIYELFHILNTTWLNIPESFSDLYL